MRAPVDHIAAPPFPAKLRWVNVASLRMDQQLGRPVLIEFWDFCRANSLRTLPYVKRWHERYEPDGLRVIGVHASGFPPSEEPDRVADAVARLGIPYPVVIDAEFEIWQEYGNLGWPARYLFGPDGMLFDFHYGEGAYEETEAAIQELLGIQRAPLPPVRPEDAPGVELVPQTEDVVGPYSGPYEAGEVWAVLEGPGEVQVGERTIEVREPGCYLLVAHERSATAFLDLQLGPGVTCYAVCFEPGLPRSATETPQIHE